MNKYFKSMDEIDAYLESVKGKIDEEIYEALSEVLGRGKQMGESIDVEGIGVIDIYIAHIIKKLNNKGFKTLASCSGIKAEHEASKFFTASPYISFKFNESKINTIKQIANKLNILFEEGECYLEKSYCIRLKHSKNEELTDEEIMLLWNRFENEIDNL